MYVCMLFGLDGMYVRVERGLVSLTINKYIREDTDD